MENGQGIIRIRGARVHNLKGVDLDLPLKQLICFAGPSGSGKTSLAFHTLHTESKRRFVNSFPNSMRFFTDRPSAVEVDEIYPVLPVFGLPQTNPVMGSRSVVADVMRGTDALQGLYFNYAKEHCPVHGEEIRSVPFHAQLAQTVASLKGEVFHLLVDAELGAALFGESFAPSRSWDVKAKTVRPFEATDTQWEVMRFKRGGEAGAEERNREIVPRLEGRPLALWAEGMKKVLPFRFVSRRRCPSCNYAGKSGLTAGAFSPHTALGACKSCNGYGANLVWDEEKRLDRELSFDEGGVAFLGFGPLDPWREDLRKTMKKRKWPTDVPLKKLPREFFRALEEGDGVWDGFPKVQKYLESKRYKPAVRVFIRKMQREQVCADCRGSRLDRSVDNFLLPWGAGKRALKDLSPLTISEFAALATSGTSADGEHAHKLAGELAHKAVLAKTMGLGHLQMGRKTRSLSAGEYQRLLLLKYLSFQGTDALFVLDEPSLGLGAAEQAMLLAGLREVIAQGNTVVVIDHSEYMQKHADHLVVMGPEAGHRGGRVLYAGPVSGYAFPQVEEIERLPAQPRGEGRELVVRGASAHGLTWPDFSVPLGKLVWAHGPSGSGKTACLVNVLAQHLHKRIHHENLVDVPGTLATIKGASSVSDVVVVDAQLNRFTSRSTVGSLAELAPAVRRHYLKLRVSKAMGLKDGHFSRNSELGMCPRCEGKGELIIDMQYLEDIILPCEDCRGAGMKPVYAEITDGKMTVAEAFNRPIGEVLANVELTPKFRRVWEYLKILNLDYLSLERQVNSLSGGEKQRLYLLCQFLKDMRGTLVVVENLSFGLSPREIVRVGQFLTDLAKLGNTVVVIDSDPLFGKIAQTELVFGESGLTPLTGARALSRRAL